MLFKSLQIKTLVLLLATSTFHYCEAAVTTDTGEVYIEISNIISSMPGNSGDDYADATSAQKSQWGNMLKHLLDSEYDKADDTAALFSYDVVQFYDTSMSPKTTMYIVKATGSNHWGTYVMNPSYSRTLVIQAPHAIKDFNTGKEGIEVFEQTKSYFFCLAGTSRCNHSSYSSCSGTSSACGSSESFRTSDMAHTSSSIYQITTDTLFKRWDNTYFIQLHGFTKLASDPYVILSNGVTTAPSGTDYLSNFKTNLAAEDPILTFKIAHIDSWTRLIGTTNTQGRLINGSSNTCSTSASSNTARFLHIEQEKTKLRDDITGWTKVANALNNTFSAQVLPVSLLSFNAERRNQNIGVEWVTVSEINNDYFLLESSLDGHNWVKKRQVDGQGTTNSETSYTILLASTENDIYLRLSQIDYDGKRKVFYNKVVYLEGYPELSTVSLFPNPANGALTISHNQEYIDVTIFNIYGKQCKQLLNLDTKTINVNNLQEGVYIILLSNRYGSETKKLSIVR